MSKFQWSQAQRDSVVPGATVVVHSYVCPKMRYTVHHVFAHGGGVSVSNGDIMLAWSCLDPDTLQLPPDPRQLDMFAGKP